MKKIVIILFTLFSLTTFSQENKPISRGPENGSLLIIGGNADDKIFLNEFAKLVGGWDAEIVVIPTAADDNYIKKDSGFINLEAKFTKAGFSRVTIRHTRNKEESNSSEFLKPFLTAKGVWFTGGRQWRLADSYLETDTHEAIKEILKRGGVVAGSSAGATIQGSFLARGDTKMNTIMDGDHTKGLAFISNIAIDQHLLARNRHFDMFEILENHPNLLGIGLDENTGIIVQKDIFEVIGESYVAVYDGTRWSAERDTIYELPSGSKEFYFLGKGDQYDLQHRQVLINNED